ncbi:MAG: hypothetical protein KDB01_22680, partial [Planctomycetaceae bacterium]|nr:hypothetical protein [Planctomycetaceae bacterium]
MKTNPRNANSANNRAGSTLIIVIALLGVLAFIGMLFYTFAAQERAAAEYFSEGAKTQVEESDDPFPWALEQMIVGPSNQQKGSILWSPTRRFSLVRNAVGADVAPHTGSGFHVAYDQSSRLPVIDDNYDGLDDNSAVTHALINRLNFVDAMVAWGQTSWGPTFGATFGPSVEGVLGERRDFVGTDAMPEPDVDYTYPDINNLFLAYKGWSIRDNGLSATPRYEKVFTIIPSFFRPAYLKSAINQGANGLDVPTDPDWFNHNPSLLPVPHPEYSVRSFRPSELHIAGFDNAGAPVLRFLDATNPLHAAAIAALPNASGAFPLRPGEGNTNFRNSADFGKLGVWTGHGSAAPARAVSGSNPALPATFELDSDNDGDGIREGIWLDLNYPLQETSSGVKYIVLHSFTIEDLDGLIDLNTHGNLTGLPRTAAVPALVGGSNMLTNTFTSQSNQGIGPHEINPLFALAPSTATLDTSTAFTSWYGANPSTRLEQANMEWLWLLTGRIDTS